MCAYVSLSILLMLPLIRKHEHTCNAYNIIRTYICVGYIVLMNTYVCTYILVVRTIHTYTYSTRIYVHTGTYLKYSTFQVLFHFHAPAHVRRVNRSSASKTATRCVQRLPPSSSPTWTPFSRSPSPRTAPGCTFSLLPRNIRSGYTVFPLMLREREEHPWLVLFVVYLLPHCLFVYIYL